MTVGILQKAINEKAERRFQKDFEATIKLLEQSKILTRLKIQIAEKDSDSMKNLFGNAFGMFYSNSHWTKNGFLNTRTNFKKVREGIIDEYVKEETEHLLNSIEGVKDLLGELNYEQ